MKPTSVTGRLQAGKQQCLFSAEHTEQRPSPHQIDALMSLMSQSREKAVLFEFEAPQDSRVFIAGSFNGWEPATHPLKYHPEVGRFQATLLLEPGIHEYKFVVDGTWHVDTKCPHWVINDNGSLNSVIKI